QLFGPEMLADPYPTYHRLRSMNPVFKMPKIDAWLVTSYEAVNSALRSPQLSSDRFPRARQRLAPRGLEALIEDRTRSMIHMDPPDHTRLRALVNKAFTPRAVNAMESRIQHLVEELLDAVQAQGRMEVIADLAYPLPVMVIAEMLGVPPEDRASFKRWSDEMSILLSGDIVGLSEDVLRKALGAREELVEYFRAIAEQRRQNPGSDLLSALLQAEEEGGRLTEDELYSTVVLLLVAGNETTTNLLGNGLLALLRHPDQMRLVWNDPTLIPGAVEEMLRYDSPVQLTTRMAKVEMEIHGTPIPRGEWLYLVMGAANRDPEQFPDPDRFDVSRTDNRHIAFGAGAHFCLGAPLARLEAQITLRSLARRCPNLQLGSEIPEYRNNFNLRGLKALSVTL
ncbi:MAG TPA: cytochrome P450, partial [Terriglobia bacterium]|nr:cytochrome P450 [Terriglobia bacterium]